MRDQPDLAAVRVVLCDLDGVVWLAHQPIPGSAEAVERIRAAGRRVLFVTNNSSAPQAEVVASLAEVGIAAGGDVVLCDLDGVVWLAHQPIPGSAEAVERIRAAGRRVLFVTNNSSAPQADVVASLAEVGIAADGDVVTSAMAAASLTEPGQRVLVSGGAGIVEAVEHRGAEVVLNTADADLRTVDAVVAGIDFLFDYQRLDRVARVVRDGARFIATNTDSTYPTPDGLLPGGGSLIAAIETASGVTAEVAGKPHAPMARHVSEMSGVGPSEMLMVGDRLDTDGSFAAELGCPFALVRTGVTAPATVLGEAPEPALDLPDLSALADLFGAPADR